MPRPKLFEEKRHDLHVYLNPREYEWLQKLAHDRGESMGHVVRTWVQERQQRGE